MYVVEYNDSIVRVSIIEPKKNTLEYWNPYTKRLYNPFAPGEGEAFFNNMQEAQSFAEGFHAALYFIQNKIDNIL